MFVEEAQPGYVACLPGSGSGARFGAGPHQHFLTPGLKTFSQRSKAPVLAV